MSFKKGEVVIYNNEARIVEKVDKISIDGLGGGSFVTLHIINLK